MKFVVSFILLLSLGLSSGWTIFDSLKDGFDTVYKYENSSLFSYKDFKDFQGHTFDVLLRKSSQDDSKKFVVHLENVQLQGTHEDPPTDADLEALLLPIVVYVGNENNLEFEIKATEADTWRSLNWKYWNFMLLLHGKEDQINAMESSGLHTNEVTISGLPFGKCKTSLNLIKSNGQVGIEVATARDNCKNELHNTILGWISKYNATDIQGDSEYKVQFYYDDTTFQFLRCSQKMKGKLVNDQEMNFFFGKEVHFDSFKEIGDVFDETKNTKVYRNYEFH